MKKTTENGWAGNWKRECGIRLLPLALTVVAGCGTQPSPGPVAPANTAYTYFGGSNVFTIDDAADTFVQYNLPGVVSQVQYSGSYTALPNGILNIGLSYVGLSGQNYTYSHPLMGNWAVVWPGQVGFVSTQNFLSVPMIPFPVIPFVSNQACPSLANAETFQFITLPVGQSSKSVNQTSIAFGSVAIVTSGVAVNFSNLQQFTLPATIGGAPGAPAKPVPSSAAGACSATAYGQVISVPVTITIPNPGLNPTVPTATIAISPSGFFLANGSVLTGGSGAIGLPVPSSPLNSNALAGAQYAGFLSGSGAPAANSIPAVAASSLIASFGFPNLQTACATLPVPQTATMIYGGDFPGDNATSTSASTPPNLNSPYGNCDFVIDLGPQSTASNGLYPAATMWIGPGFPGNTSNAWYSSPAAAVAGQIQGKYAIFVIGLDTTGLKNPLQSQVWSGYLLQSN